MAVVLGATESSVAVESYCFALLTDDGPLEPLLEVEPEPEFAYAEDHGLGLFSAGTNHTAVVRLEFLDAEPQAPAGSGSSTGATTDIAWLQTTDGSVVRTAEFTVHLGDGPPVLQGLEASERVPLEAPPFTGRVRVRVRVACSGRERADELTHAQGELFYEGVERWLVRIWPS